MPRGAVTVDGVTAEDRGGGKCEELARRVLNMGRWYRLKVFRGVSWGEGNVLQHGW